MLMHKGEYLSGGRHLGHLLMDSLGGRDPSALCTIDAVTGERETNGSVLFRSVALAASLRRAGLAPGDVLLLSGTLHLDIHIPFYAAMLNGMPVLGIAPCSKYDEIKPIFKKTMPKIVFCEHEDSDVFRRVAADLAADVTVVAFGAGKCSLHAFVETHGDNKSTGEFQVAEFDTDTIYAWLICTGGTTGMQKVAAFKHNDVVEKLFQNAEIISTSEDRSKLFCYLYSVQWLTWYIDAIFCPLMNQCKLLISRADDIQHVADVINKYRPAFLTTIPSTVRGLLASERPCDMTCFDAVVFIGSAVPERLMLQLKSRLRAGALAAERYGLTEMLGLVLRYGGGAPLGSCGRAHPLRPVKLVDPETGADVTEPHVTGELCARGPRFTEYYNDPEETARAFTSDGWFKTGDLLYRDHEHNYYFVERRKLLISCRSLFVFPLELEDVIMRHPGVREVCVVGAPAPAPRAPGDREPVACVVRRPGVTPPVTAQEIKHLVTEALPVHRQLCGAGGVVFAARLPRTRCGKVARADVLQMALHAPRE